MATGAAASTGAATTGAAAATGAVAATRDNRIATVSVSYSS